MTVTTKKDDHEPVVQKDPAVMPPCVRVTFGHARHAHVAAPGLRILLQTACLLVEGTTSVIRAQDADGKTLFLCGPDIGGRTLTGSYSPLDTAQAILFLSSRPFASAIAGLEGKFTLICVEPDGTCRIVTDRAGRADLFYRMTEQGGCFATRLDLIPSPAEGGYDQPSLAHFLCIYGYRPPKRHTFYRGLKRLGVGQQVRICPDAAHIDDEAFSPRQIQPYGDADLERYKELFLDAVASRSSARGNIIYLSSGWDSSAILAALVHLHGPRNVRAVIGRMRYASGGAIANPFEIDRALRIAAFFDVRCDIVELDHAHNGPAFLESILPELRSAHISSLTVLNHFYLAQAVSRIRREGEAVFCGEISDGAHNFGFCQNVTVYHADISFREYADKMACYLFGPTFYEQVLTRVHRQDPVYQFFRWRLDPLVFDDEPSIGEEEPSMVLMKAMFLSPVRIPFYSLRNARLLTGRGRAEYLAEMSGYFPAKEAVPSSAELYARYLQLYRSFHWQSSTVSCIDLAAERCGFPMRLPFADERLLDFLSAMPETWGRGLDLHPTKYPLKWILKHRIPYPYELQRGPHSYLYDVDPSFNHAAELMYRSSFSPYLKQKADLSFYERILSSDHFDMGYIAGLLRSYREGNSPDGSARNDLFALLMLAWVPPY